MKGIKVIVENMGWMSDDKKLLEQIKRERADHAEQVRKLEAELSDLKEALKANRLDYEEMKKRVSVIREAWLWDLGQQGLNHYEAESIVREAIYKGSGKAA